MLTTVFSMDPFTVAMFMAAATVLYVTPGADLMFTVACGIAGGPRAGAAAALGISCGVLVHVGFAAAGLAVMLLAYPAAYDAIRYIGAAYLLWLAVQSWRDRGHLRKERGAGLISRAYRRGFLTNILNPKPALFILAFLPQFTDPGIGPVWIQIVALGLMLALGGLAFDGMVGVFAGIAADRLRRWSGAFNKLSAIVFGGLAARLMWD